MEGYNYTTANDFLHLYLEFCRKKEIHPNDYVRLAIKNAAVSTSGEGLYLNLCNVNVSLENAGILAECLTVDRTFDEISLSDCMLSEEAFRSIIDGLRTNAFCKRLVLKGNNIRGRSVQLLGTYLSSNSSLKCLILEWNQLGMLDKSFGEFCDGLCQNSCLEILDLRNNQLNHQCAAEISKVLRKNSTLAVLDLRWNSLGVLGSRELLNGLQRNRSLCQLDLVGNEVPQDIITAIDIATRHNAENSKLTNSQKEHALQLERKLNEQGRTARRQIDRLTEKLDTVESSQFHQSKRSEHRVRQLQTLLEEKKHAYNQQMSKLSLAESHLAIVESKYSELQKVMHSLVLEKEEATKKHAQELRNERNEALQTETTCRKEIDNLTLKVSQLQNQLEEAENRVRGLKEQKMEMQEEMAHLNADVKIKQSQMEEKLQEEKLKFRDLLMDLETSKDREIAKQKVDMEAELRAVKERFSRSERERGELDSEVSRLRTQMQGEKMAAEEAANALRTKLRVEEEQRTAGMEERLRSVQISKDALLKETHTQAARISELERNNASLNTELSSQRRRLEETQAELSSAKADSASAGQRVRTELSDRMALLEEENRSKNRQLEDQTATVQRLREENATLKEQLAGRDAALKRVKEDEMARAGMLRAAVLQFCQPLERADSN